MKNKIKYLLAAMFCLFLLTGCGAQLDTVMTFDEGFSGSRVITAELAKSDIDSYVDGGIPAIDEIIKKNLPDILAAEKSETDSSLVYTFTLKFDSIEDYAEKVKKLMKTTEEDEQPEIVFEYSDSPFKKGLDFSESFGSKNLLTWLSDAVEESKIADTDRSNYFSYNTNKVVFGEEEFDCYDDLSAKNSETFPAKSVTVDTVLLPSGNFDRTIEILFGNDTLEKIAENGDSTDTFFSALAGSCEFNRNEYADKNEVGYSFAVKDKTAEEIISFTNSMLFSDNTVLSMELTPSENNPRQLFINISARCVGDYYFDSRNGNLTEKYHLYDGIDYDKNSAFYTYYNDDGARYFQYSRRFAEDDPPLEGKFLWEISFTGADCDLGLSKDKADLSIKLYAPELTQAIDILEPAVTKAAPDKVSVRRDDNVFTVDFGKGSSEEISDRYRNFVYNYSGEKVKCSLGCEVIASGNPFKTYKLYSADVDTSALTGGECTFAFDGNAVQLSNSKVTLSEESKRGRLIGTFTGNPKFYALESGINFTGILFTLTGVVSAAIFIIIAAAEAVKYSKAPKKPKAPKPAAADDSAPVEGKTAETRPADTAEEKASEEKLYETENNDEEEYI